MFRTVVNYIRSKKHTAKPFIKNEEYRKVCLWCAQRNINICVVIAINKVHYYYVRLERGGDTIEVDSLSECKQAAIDRWQIPVYG